MYQLIVAGLQIFLDIATRLKHVFKGLMTIIATRGILHPQMLVL